MPSNIEAIVNRTFEQEDETILQNISNYLTLLFKWHDTNNIVSSSDIDYVIKREIYDSYEFSKLLTGSSISDIGTGGGIPGIIIAILNPDIEVSLIDRKSTFIDFLTFAKAKLNLKNVKIFKKDILKPNFSLNTDTVVMKNFSNKKISKMSFETKFIYLMKIIKKSKRVSKAYMLTGSPVLELSKGCIKEFELKTCKIQTPFFNTNRFVAEARFENIIDS
jgi:16S rRNA (guanine(527)-N(7))-methyltransferase RsmG